MKCIRLFVRVIVGLNEGALGLGENVVVMTLLLLLFLFVCSCGLCGSGSDSFRCVSFMCMSMSGVPGVNCGEGMMLRCWCRL